MIEKIIGRHAGATARAGEIHDVEIDARVARGFGGANVVRNLVDHGLDLADPARTFFTFDCNPTGSDQNYAANQQARRVFARQARAGDIVVAGGDFGAGSSRQQAVDCFLALGIQAIVARSFGAIYERNAINAGLPALVCDLSGSGVRDGEQVTIDFQSGVDTRATGERVQAEPFSPVQMKIHQGGGLLQTT